jgi:DNA-binding SARP family transcriptional activator
VLDGSTAGASAIDYASRAYRLVLDEHDSVDVDAFERAADAALAAAGPRRLRLLEHAAALWTGEPLPEERYADWTRAWRLRLEARYGMVLAALLDLHLEAGEHAAAIDAAVRALELDPLDERMHRALMVAYARQGRRGRALRQFLECRRALVDALGVEPSVDTARVHARLLAGERV